MDHDKRTSTRQFSVGENVFVKNHGKGDKWITGTITGSSGPLSFKVQVQDGHIVRCHQDHLRKRGEVPESQTVESEDFTDYGLPQTQEVPDTQSPETSDTLQESSATARVPPQTAIPPTDAPTHRTYPSRNRRPPDWYHN